jgi:subtilisin family serine protease
MPWQDDAAWTDALGASADIIVGGERREDGTSTEFLFRPDQLLCDDFVWTRPRNSAEEEMRTRLRDAGADELSGDDDRIGTAERLGLKLLTVPSDAAHDLVRTSRDVAPDSVNFNHVLVANPQRYGGCAPPVLLAQPPGVAIPGTGPEGATLKIAVLDTGIAEGVTFVDPASDTEPAGFSNEGAIGHGTMVAGAIARTAAGATILVKQVLEPPLGVADELQIARALDELPADVDVINASFGGPAADDERMLGLLRALERLPEETVVIASAGNEASDRPHYMAAFERVVAVASVEAPGDADYSNRGEWVDLSTQGTDVVTLRAPNAFVQATGTSFAAPKVAAQAMTFPGGTQNLRAAIQWLIANGGQAVGGRGTFIDLPEP